jgi:hypothetical protein
VTSDNEAAKFLLIFTSVIVLATGGALYQDHKDSILRQKECDKHNGKDWIEETFLAKTNEGCSVYHVTVFDGKSCFPSNNFDVTDCAGVCWNERHGKSTTRRCNVNQ